MQPLPDAAARPASAPAERRAYVRYACDAPTSCQLLTAAHGPVWQARVVNLSVGGVGLRQGQPVQPGAALLVNLESPQDGTSRTLVGRVMHCTPSGQGEWLVGCQFARTLRFHELLELLV